MPPKDIKNMSVCFSEIQCERKVHGEKLRRGPGLPFLLNWPQTEFSLFLLKKGRETSLYVWEGAGGIHACGCLWV